MHIFAQEFEFKVERHQLLPAPKNMPTRSSLADHVAALLALAFGLQAAHAQPARTPRQPIGGLAIEIRKILENPESARTSG